MRLGDLLPYLTMAQIVRVWSNGEVISTYDGKNSIPVEHNELLVEENGIFAFNNGESAFGCGIDVYCYER